MLYFIYKKLSQSLNGSGLSKIGFIRSTHQKLIKNLAPEIVEFDGLKMYHLGQLSQENNDYLNILKQNIYQGNTVLDIGANIGYYTLIMSKLVGSTGKVYAFEPEPKNFEILKKNIELNKLDNVILEQKALSDIDGVTYLELSKDSGQHRLSDHGVKVESITLDSYFQGGEIDFIKMDAEGSEYKIFKGMKNALKNKNLKIVTEFYYKLLDNPAAFFYDLEDRFKLYDIRNNMKSVDKKEFFSKYNMNSGATDLFCK